MTLTEFLLARIAEDEEWAMTSASTSTPGSFTRDNYGALLIQPTRVLAECEAKRRIIELANEQWGELDLYTTGEIPPEWVRVLELLALPYADHPDYRQEWKP